jgi:hypothetical protein
MAESEVQRDEPVRLTGQSCSFTFRRLRPGVMLVAITGFDRGEHGARALDEMQAEITRFGPLHLFVDARDATGATTAVSDAWTAWFQASSKSLRQVRILVGSRHLKQTVAVSKLFSRTGDLIRIESDPAAFDAAIARVAPGSAPESARS